jgi:hypothetical protein
LNSATSLFTHLFGRRTEKKVKAKIKTSTKADYGSGSWEAGYSCPELQIAKGSADLKIEGAGTFLAKRLETPVTQAEKLGWCFKMTTGPGDNLKQIMIQDGSTTNWCLQFRYMSSTFSYTNPSGYKFIEGWYTNDFGQAYRFRVNLPWAYSGWYINDDEGKKICTFLNNQATTANNNIISAKSNIKSECSKYMINKPLYDESNGKATDLTKQKADLETKLTGLNAELAKAQTGFDTAKKEADSLSSQATVLETKLKASREAADGLSSQYSQIHNMLQTTLSSSSSSSTDATKLKTEVDENLNKFNTELDILKAEAPQRPIEINGAKAANEKLDASGVTKNLSGIYS